LKRTILFQIFWIKEDPANFVQRFLEQRKRNLLIQKSSKLKRIKEVSSKTSQEQRGANTGILKLFRSELNKQRYSKAIQEQRVTNQIIPMLFRTEVKQTKLFQNLSRSKLIKLK